MFVVMLLHAWSQINMKDRQDIWKHGYQLSFSFSKAEPQTEHLAHNNLCHKSTTQMLYHEVNFKTGSEFLVHGLKDGCGIWSEALSDDDNSG